MESDGGEREEWWTVMNGGWGVGWGLLKGEAVLLGRRHPCARSSSVCALVVRVRARRLCARSSSVCTLVIRVRARRPVHGRSLCVGGASSSGGGGRRLRALGGLSIRGGVLFMGAVSLSWALGCCSWALGCRLEAVGLVPVGGLFVCAGLSFVGAVVTCRLLCGRC